jgi:hypothetical protein
MKDLPAEVRGTQTGLERADKNSRQNAYHLMLVKLSESKVLTEVLTYVTKSADKNHSDSADIITHHRPP